MSESWAQHLLHRMGCVKKKGNTKTQVLPAIFEDIWRTFLKQMKSIIKLEEIPSQFVTNWEQTTCSYVPVLEWTIEKETAKHADCGALHEKLQITTNFGGSFCGSTFPVQLMYQGTMKSYNSTYSIPDDCTLPTKLITRLLNRHTGLR